MQTSSTISVRTSVGRCKSPGIVEFENSEVWGLWIWKLQIPIKSEAL